MKEYIVGVENEHSHALDVCYKEELIRCKDCKYWKFGRCHNANNGDGAKYYRAPIKSEDGYCDWAEREEE